MCVLACKLHLPSTFYSTIFCVVSVLDLNNFGFQPFVYAFLFVYYLHFSQIVCLFC